MKEPLKLVRLENIQDKLSAAYAYAEAAGARSGRAGHHNTATEMQRIMEDLEPIINRVQELIEQEAD